jgi:outer membrane receptor for ferrienterochelin and colicins
MLLYIIIRTIRICSRENLLSYLLIFRLVPFIQRVTNKRQTSSKDNMKTLPKYFVVSSLSILNIAISTAFAQTTANTATAQDKTEKIDKVEVTGQRPALKPKLRDDIIATETITPAQIQKVGASNINEAIDKNPGISIQTECSICNVRNVLLNNLPGRFTTLLIDGVPIYSSVSSAYGLDSVGVNGVERIDVSRGAGASLIAPEALAGVVNLITKRPTESERIIDLQGGNFGSYRADVYVAQPFTGGAFTASFNANNHKQIDADGNGISEYTGYERYLGGVGLFLDNVAGFKIKSRIDFVKEDRGGGAFGRDYQAIKDSLTGNSFDWRRGPNGSPDQRGWIRPDGNFDQAVLDGQNPILLGDGRVLLPYDGGRGGFSEIIFTKRDQAVVVGERKLGAGTLRLAAGYATHKQDSFYEGDFYKAKQKQYYLEASTQHPFNADTSLTVGTSYRFENLRSNGFSISNNADTNGVDNYSYKVPGVFLQLYRAQFDNQLEINGSVRYDKHNVFGGITSPRLNVLLHHSDQWDSRVAIGRGFRAPTSFFEQDHGLLSDSRVDRQVTRAEISDNISYTLSYASDRLAGALNVNRNRIKNMALLIPGVEDPQDATRTVTIFTSAKNPVTYTGADIQMSYKVTKALTTTVAYEQYKYDFKVEPGAIYFARPKNKAYFTLDYESALWDLFARATWNGRANLRQFYDYDNNPRFNFDGTAKRDFSPTFTTVDVRGSYKFNSMWSVFAGVDNLTDYQQGKKESFLFVDSEGGPDVVQLWGPSRGRFAYAGVKVKF